MRPFASISSTAALKAAVSAGDFRLSLSFTGLQLGSLRRTLALMALATSAADLGRRSLLKAAGYCARMASILFVCSGLTVRPWSCAPGVVLSFPWSIGCPFHCMCS